MLIATSEQQFAFDISEDLATAIGNVNPRVRNSILTQMAADPLEVLAGYGLDDAFFAGADAPLKAAYVSMLQQDAQDQIRQNANGHATRSYHWFACWSCRIGFGAIIVAAGVALSAVTAGAGGPIFAAIVAQVVVRVGIALAAATTLVTGAIATGSFIGAGAIAGLIELVCEAIPNTCGNN